MRQVGNNGRVGVQGILLACSLTAENKIGSARFCICKGLHDPFKLGLVLDRANRSRPGFRGRAADRRELAYKLVEYFFGNI